ncbi:MAG: hypothetical protein ACFFDM_13135, partial [Candidatus Thorarchaeota archaeon]
FRIEIESTIGSFCYFDEDALGVREKERIKEISGGIISFKVHEMNIPRYYEILTSDRRKEMM